MYGQRGGSKHECSSSIEVVMDEDYTHNLTKRKRKGRQVVDERVDDGRCLEQWGVFGSRNEVGCSILFGGNAVLYMERGIHHNSCTQHPQDNRSLRCRKHNLLSKL